jgi:nitrogen-specific signal transduction histidine kinase
MTKPPGPASSPQSPSADAAHDRRANPELRRLIEEMLDRVRQLNRNLDVWSPEERAHAEADLELVMARVRRLAGERHAR